MASRWAEEIRRLVTSCCVYTCSLVFGAHTAGLPPPATRLSGHAMIIGHTAHQASAHDKDAATRISVYVARRFTACILYRLCRK